MKKLVAALFLLAAAGTVHAQSGSMTVHKATGVVTKVDKDKVTIKHEPVRTTNWPTMTMAFVVKDKAMLDKVARDRKVDFEFVQQGKDYVITSIK
jgi:Cu(I)/Ag(I) efflux system protein CusF